MGHQLPLLGGVPRDPGRGTSQAPPPPGQSSPPPRPRLRSGGLRAPLPHRRPAEGWLHRGLPGLTHSRCPASPALPARHPSPSSERQPEAGLWPPGGLWEDEAGRAAGMPEMGGWWQGCWEPSRGLEKLEEEKEEGGMREPGLGPALDPRWAGGWRRVGAPPAERVVARGPCTAGKGLCLSIDVPRPWWTILRMCPWTLATRRSWRRCCQDQVRSDSGSWAGTHSVLQIYSFRFIHSGCTRRRAPNTPRTDQTRSCPPILWSWGEGTNR